jgi:hypothetical protein
MLDLNKPPKAIPRAKPPGHATAYSSRRGSVILEMARQSQVFFDDDDFDSESAAEGNDSEAKSLIVPKANGEGIGDVYIHGRRASRRDAYINDSATEEDGDTSDGEATTLM